MCIHTEDVFVGSIQEKQGIEEHTKGIEQEKSESDDLVEWKWPQSKEEVCLHNLLIMLMIYLSIIYMYIYIYICCYVLYIHVQLHMHLSTCASISIYLSLCCVSDIYYTVILLS